MLTTELSNLTPLIITATGAVMLMLLLVIKPGHLFMTGGCLFVYMMGIGSLFNTQPYYQSLLFTFDGFGKLFMGLILTAGGLLTILSYPYFKIREVNPGTYYVLLLLSTLGAQVLCVSTHFISLFLGLEILSVGLYTLIAYQRERKTAIEAGMKYLIMAAFSSSFLLFGMALIYSETGTMAFATIATAMRQQAITSPFIIIALAFFLVGIGFKLSLVPFHLWAADVYQGASTPITAFIATISKGGMLIIALRFFGLYRLTELETVSIILSVIAIASALVGNILALKQNNVKRILAYSSIANMGYLIMALLSMKKHGNGVETATLYTSIYFIALIASFGVITLLASKENEADKLDDLKGLFVNQPVLATIMTISMLSLAGIPLTAGFIGKFYLLKAGISTHQWLLMFTLILASAIGLFYYLKIIVAMFSEQSEAMPQKTSSPILNTFVLFLLAISLIYLGIYPTQLVEFIQSILQ
ncbi:NADH-quinone oxidoreductase subunit N [Solitalea lacus]|uniref:NADH-quinone oxidoreductase subunit N n=1 Tax=Solitalea lacus TaxID=2911172 RepID=UPI001EDA9908|nr:NADH-quinone oxidoreductase subunit N [Solitalea lacus]UKJ07172.1 NADH-quinone oxidoreductase subunit N [Solitalea lacus]